MKRIIGLSLACAAMLSASEATIETLEVESTKLTDVSGEEVKSADLADVLGDLPNVNIIRRSGIANDILLRGQKRDNINVTVDGSRTYGACPNRMDPPTSHVVNYNIEGVEVTEGPFNVEEFGVLSGDVTITTKEPTKEAHGELNFNMGSFDYKKASATVSGGNDTLQLMVVGSTESGGQYIDGNGDTLYEQNIKSDAAMASQKYLPEAKDMDAFSKQSVMVKANVNVTDDQQLKLSYTDNMSRDILYPNTGMDAIYDASRIYNAEYLLKNLGAFSKELSVSAYQSNVDHPMSTLYRAMPGGAANEVISHLNTETVGMKIKNRMEIAETEITLGLDGSNRNWDGAYIGEGGNAGFTGMYAINDVDTINRALFAEADRDYGDFDVKLGMRYDMTTVDSANPMYEENEYNTLGGFLYTAYNWSPSTKLFAGLGQSHRVPDARELYFQGKMKVPGTPPTFSNPLVGTDDLEETTNNEIDLGIEQKFESFDYKFKYFYSRMLNYIYHYKASGMNQFANIDASIQGIELDGSIYASDTLSVDFGLAYLRGKKLTLPEGHNDKDLADIPPLKGMVGLSYLYSGESYARVEVQAADAWDSYDADTGEQELAGYAIANLKVSHDVNPHFNITVGMDNVFNKAYAVSNTYNDLTLIQTGGETLLLNEPGRYTYANVTLKF